ncbi:MAG: LacI family DNA-binding transcriptional regulator [Anaerolineae bacterium]|nr:LacI family DNA-binding transcriptional regulator [Anaerolineae bacterium]
MSHRGRVTIADVAKAVGVSAGTVSRVLNPRLNDNVKISDATRQLVLAAVKELGYQANPFASALRTQRSGVVGAIIRDVSDPFLSLMSRELQHMAHRQGIDLMLCHAEYDLETVRRQLKFMIKWFDGLLLIGDMPGDRVVFQDLQEHNIPFVAVACGTQVNAPFVNTDEERGMTLGMDYLYNLGHRRIAFIGTIDHAGTRERLSSYQEYVAQKSLIWHDDYVQPCAYTRSAAIDAAQTLLSLAEPPTAIFCTSDLQALGAVSGALQMGWRVPEMVSILGFDDIEESNFTFPSLSTIRQPVGALAEAAMNLLMSLIEGNTPEHQGVVIQPRLMVRRSCCPTYT